MASNGGEAWCALGVCRRKSEMTSRTSLLREQPLAFQHVHQAGDCPHVGDGQLRNGDGLSLGSSCSAMWLLPFLDLFVLAAHAGSNVCPRLCAGTLLHHAATPRAFLTSRRGHVAF